MHVCISQLLGCKYKLSYPILTVSSGNTLKHAVSVPSSEHSTIVLVGGGSGREEPVSPAGAGSPTPVSMSIPRGVSAHPLGIISHARDGARMTDSHRVSQPIIYDDLNSGTVATNLGSQSGVPNLFGLSAPVYGGRNAGWGI